MKYPGQKTAVLWDAPVSAERPLHLQVPEFVRRAPDQITLLACRVLRTRSRLALSGGLKRQ
jgi:hypothetical protein